MRTEPATAARYTGSYPGRPDQVRLVSSGRRSSRRGFLSQHTWPYGSGCRAMYGWPGTA